MTLRSVEIFDTVPEFIDEHQITKSCVKRTYAGDIGCRCGCLGNYRDSDPTSSEYSPSAVTRRFNAVTQADDITAYFNEDGVLSVIECRGKGKVKTLYLTDD